MPEAVLCVPGTLIKIQDLPDFPVFTVADGDQEDAASLLQFLEAARISGLVISSNIELAGTEALLRLRDEVNRVIEERGL